MKVGLLLSVVVLSALASPLYAQSNNWLFGPVSIEDHYSLGLPHASFRPDSPEVLQQNQNFLRSQFVWSSDYNLVEGSYLIDAEVRSLQLEYKRGIFENLEVGLRIPLLWKGGGDLDNAIDWFHDFFSFPDGKREKSEDDDYVIAGVNRDGSIFSFTETGSELGDLTLSTKYLFSKGDQSLPALSGIFELRLPTATADEYGAGGIDLQVGLLSSKRWESFAMYFGGAYSFFEDTSEGNLSYERHHGSSFLTAEYALTEYLALSVTAQIYSRLVRELSDFPSYAVYLDTAAKIRLAEGTMLELLLRENPTPTEATADVSFLVALSHKFDSN